MSKNHTPSPKKNVFMNQACYLHRFTYTFLTMGLIFKSICSSLGSSQPKGLCHWLHRHHDRNHRVFSWVSLVPACRDQWCFWRVLRVMGNGCGAAHSVQCQPRWRVVHIHQPHCEHNILLSGEKIRLNMLLDGLQKLALLYNYKMMFYKMILLMTGH